MNCVEAVHVESRSQAHRDYKSTVRLRRSPSSKISQVLLQGRACELGVPHHRSTLFVFVMVSRYVL